MKTRSRLPCPMPWDMPAMQLLQDKKLAGPVEAVVELYDKFIAGFAKDGALPTLDELLRMPRVCECHARSRVCPPIAPPQDALRRV